MKLEGLWKSFLRWAEAQPDIEGVAIAGSYARGTQREDSDLDLMILTCAPTRYLDSHDWLIQFGEVVSCSRESWGCVETVRALYKSGLEVEFNFAPPSWTDVPVDPGTQRVASEGLQVLFDPKGKFETLQHALATDLKQ